MYFRHLHFLPSVIDDGKETFSNIPSSENDTVNETGGSATDGTENLSVYEEEQWKSTQNSQSDSGS